FFGVKHRPRRRDTQRAPPGPVTGWPECPAGLPFRNLLTTCHVYETIEVRTSQLRLRVGDDIGRRWHSVSSRIRLRLRDSRAERPRELLRGAGAQSPLDAAAGGALLTRQPADRRR